MVTSNTIRTQNGIPYNIIYYNKHGKYQKGVFTMFIVISGLHVPILLFLK